MGTDSGARLNVAGAGDGLSAGGVRSTLSFLAGAEAAREVGDLVGKLHAASAVDPAAAALFATDENFDALRVTPYLRVTAHTHPDLRQRLDDLAARTAGTHLAVVHGDVSPQNILLGPHGPVLLDAECAWFGDPAFDVAFCINHLLIKSVKVPAAATALDAAVRALAAAHARHVRWEPASHLEDRVAALTPLQYPRKVICTGSNYLDHVTKDGGHASFSKEDNVPVFFLKPPTTTLVGQGASVRYPAQSAKFDYELELAVIIGRRGRKIPVGQARDFVAGYAIGLDMSARDWQRHPKHLVKFDLFGGKAFDDSCPLGPGIVPARFVDERDLRLRLRVNGELRQDASTADMIWDVAEQIAHISEHVTLEPGDVIMTGTPAGVGLSTGTWLKAGDRLEAEITGLGTLTVQITDDQ